MQRRSFLSLAAAAVSGAVYGQSRATMFKPPVRPVGSGKDCFGESHNLGITSIAFKVAPRDTNGELFVIEHTTRQKGGPPRHIHLYQDEWFYVIEGEVLFEVGDNRMTLRNGESVLAPRNVPHVWAFTGSGGGRMLISYTPARRMEEFFLHVTRSHGMPLQDKGLFQAFDMILVGPPLAI
jgi:quercetin dioxygenase-like cupin family protein